MECSAARKIDSQPDETTQTSEPLHWKPDSRGDAVAGTLIEVVRVRVGRKKVPAAIIREEDGCEWSVLLGYTVLEKKWKKLSPRPGVHVEIKHLGEEQSRSGAFYKLFDLKARSEPDPRRTSRSKAAVMGSARTVADARSETDSSKPGYKGHKAEDLFHLTERESTRGPRDRTMNRVSSSSKRLGDGRSLNSSTSDVSPEDSDNA